MQELSIEESAVVSGGGMGNAAIVIIALSGLSGSVVGGGSGIYIASQMSLTYAVLPIVMAGSFSAGATIGMLVGVAVGVGGICAKLGYENIRC